MANQIRRVVSGWLEKFNQVELGAAIGFTLVAVLWRVELAASADPLAVVALPFMAVGLAIGVGMVLFMGAAGYLVLQLIRLIVLWRARDEFRQGMSNIQVVWIVAGLFFLGIPELADKISWWQEHGLGLIPGEKVVLHQIATYCKANFDSIAGCVVLAGIGCLLFWKLFKDFRGWLRQLAVLMKGLLENRNWRFAVFFVVTMIGTGLTLAMSQSDRFEALLEQLLSIEFIFLMAWVFLPILAPNLYWLIPAAACMGPSLIVNKRLGGDSFLGYILVLFVWGAWLFSILVVRNKFWRPVYWLGVLGFLTYLVR